MFADRLEAGQRLAKALQREKFDPDPVVLGLPRGGVPVAAEVARELGAPLDVIVVRKIGVPGQVELAMGAVGEDGVRVLNRDVVRRADVSEEELEATSAAEWREVERRARQYRAIRPRESLVDRTALIIDDGIATGATARVACQVATEHGARQVVIAVPVAPVGWTSAFRDVADRCVALETPSGFFAVGAHYQDFRPTSDDEVARCLAEAAAAPAVEEVTIPVASGHLAGVLSVPAHPRGVGVFAHGSGSSHRSSRNRFVADRLVEAGLATALVDLLTEREGHDRSLVFDIDFLTERLVQLTGWLRGRSELSALRLGFFGASTGAAAALAAAAQMGEEVAAVVSRGGRPDLAEAVLPQVVCPTLLIVGGADVVVLDLNIRARTSLRCPSELMVVPDATHLFEEPGALEAVADAAGRWFTQHLGSDLGEQVP
jgi:putative phosphoribosyl transferase